MSRDANRISTSVLEGLRHPCGGFDLGNRVADDEVHARGAAQGLGHVSLFSKSWPAPCQTPEWLHHIEKWN